MLLSLLIAVGLLCAFLARIGWHRSSRAFIISLVVFFLGVGYGAIPYWCAGRLQSGFKTDYHGHWGQQSVIVLLGGGTEQLAGKADVEPNLIGYARITRAYAQYKSCKQQGGACIVLVTGGDPQSHHVSEAEIYATMLRRLGIPITDLQTEEQSRNTWENAKFAAPLINALHPDTIVLVTSGTHLYRSQLYFSHFGIHATPVRSEYVTAEFHFFPSFYNFVVMDIVIHEYIGLARYYVYQMLGLN